jgi:protein-serine/threonine kinase
MKYKGNPWSAAEPGDKLYDKFSKGWEAWLANNPDTDINEGPDGSPKCGPIIQNVTLPALKRLILKMTHPNPVKRIQIQDVVNDRWVKQIECCVLENEAACDGGIDASARKSCRLASKSLVKKLHNHLPPVKVKAVYDFDLGDGY